MTGRFLSVANAANSFVRTTLYHDRHHAGRCDAAPGVPYNDGEATVKPLSQMISQRQYLRRQAGHLRDQHDTRVPGYRGRGGTRHGYSHHR